MPPFDELLENEEDKDLKDNVLDVLDDLDINNQEEEKELEVTDENVTTIPEQQFSTVQDIHAQPENLTDEEALTAANNGSLLIQEQKKFSPVLNERKEGLSTGAKIRKFFGKILGGIGSAIGVFNRLFTTHGKERNNEKKITAKLNSREYQKTVNNNVMDTGGIKIRLGDLNVGTEDNQSVYGDVRKVPLVWEQRIAGRQEDIYKPTAALHMTLSKTYRTDNDMETESTGHSSIQLRYSRLNPQTKRVERYQLKFGFYPAGGFGNMNWQREEFKTMAMVPGVLQDDSEESHKISAGREYNITNKQVNQILKASMDYPSGGYHIIKRNCTTFVRDVFQSAGINAENGGTSDIFRDDEFRLGSYDLGAPILTNTTQYSNRAMLNEKMQSRMGKMNKDYAYWGQKQVTEEQLRRFQEGTKQKLTDMRGISPNQTAQRLAGNYKGIDFILNDNQMAVTVIDEVDSATNFAKSIDEITERVFAEKNQKYLQKVTDALKAAKQKNKTYLDSPLSDFAVAEKMAAEIAYDYREIRKTISAWFFQVAQGDERLRDEFLALNLFCTISASEAENSIDKEHTIAYKMNDYFDYIQTNYSLNPGADNLKEEKGLMTRSLTVEKIAALIDMYGSVDKIPALILANKKSLTDEQASEQTIQNEAWNAYIKANRYYERATVASIGELERAFIVMTRGSNIEGMKAAAESAERYTQGLVWQKILPDYNNKVNSQVATNGTDVDSSQSQKNMADCILGIFTSPSVSDVGKQSMLEISAVLLKKYEGKSDQNQIALEMARSLLNSYITFSLSDAYRNLFQGISIEEANQKTQKNIESAGGLDVVINKLADAIKAIITV